MTIVSRSPKTWPYAQNSGQDSVGKLLGTLHPGLLGDILCWEAKGEARRLFERSLKKSILDYLLEHSDKAQESGSYLSIPLFMVGKRPKRAKPVVMLVSDDKVARKEAYDLVLHSDIMTKYPGFELGHSDFEKLMAWAGDSVSVFSLQQEGASDCYRLISGQEVSSRKILTSASLGALGTESIKRARNAYEDRSGDGDASPDHYSAPKKGLGIAAAALAVAGAAKYLQAGKVEREERHRGRSRSRGYNSSGDEHSRSRSYSRRRQRSHSPLAKAAIGTAAVAGLVKHFRNKSRTRSKSRSKSRLRNESFSKSTLKRSLSPSAKPGSIRTATAGGVVSYLGKHMLLSISHFLRDSPSLELPAHKFEASQISDCEITGLGDFDDDDDDETDTEFVETVRQGSVSDVDESKDSEMEDSYTPTSASESDRISQRRPSIPPQEPSSPEGRLIGKGNPVLCKEELDYALFEVVMNSPSESLLNDAISLTDLDKIESGPRKAAVRTVASNGRVVHGLVSEDTLTVRLPHSKEFIEVYTARFFGSLGPGDCGSWVRDKATGRLFGHVFAGNLSNGLTAIMPAKLVFENARALLDQQFALTAPTQPGDELQELRQAALQSLDDDDDDSAYGSAAKRPLSLPKGISNMFRSTAHTTVGQAKFIKQYVCRDPSAAGLYSDLKPDYALSQCPECSSGKKYNAYYIAADHLRRRHFKKHYQGTIVNSNSRVVRLSSAVSDLRLWTEELLVKEDEPLGSSSADVAHDEASLSTGKAPAAHDVDPSMPSFQPLIDAQFPVPSYNNFEPPLASLYQSWNMPPPGLSFSPHSMSTATPNSSSNSPYQLYNFNSHGPQSQFGIIEEGFNEFRGSTFDSIQVQGLMGPISVPFEETWTNLFPSSDADAPEKPVGSDYQFYEVPVPLTSPALTSSELPIHTLNTLVRVDEEGSSAAPISNRRQAIAGRSSGRLSGRSNSDRGRESPRFVCSICNDHPGGFRGPHELDRHMLRHKSNKMTKRFICRDPASVGIKSDIQAVNPLSKCESCSAQKRYASANGATYHLSTMHMRDPLTGTSPTVKGKRPLTEQLKDWFCEVQVDGNGRILVKASSTSADTGCGPSDMDCDNENEDTVMTSDMPEPSGSPHAGAGESGIQRVICSNCATQSGLIWQENPKRDPLCMDCRNLPTPQDSVQPSNSKTALFSSTSAAARNPHGSNTDGKGHIIRESFASIANVVKNRLPARAEIELDHARNGGGRTTDAGDSQITTTTTTSATVSTGSNNNATAGAHNGLLSTSTLSIYQSSDFSDLDNDSFLGVHYANPDVGTSSFLDDQSIWDLSLNKTPPVEPQQEHNANTGAPNDLSRSNRPGLASTNDFVADDASASLHWDAWPQK
ncbi:hypothetical protein GGI35DRAFT_440665 [Trichoderma velutinum]